MPGVILGVRDTAKNNTNKETKNTNQFLPEL